MKQIQMRLEKYEKDGEEGGKELKRRGEKTKWLQSTSVGKRRSLYLCLSPEFFLSEILLLFLLVSLFRQVETL